MIASVIALLAAAVAASDTPATPGAPPAPAGAHAPAKPTDLQNQDQVVCKYILPTGSRLGGTKVCHTRGEWAEMSHRAQDATQNQQSQGISIPGH